MLLLCYDVVLLLIYVVLYIHTLRNHGVMILAGLLWKREAETQGQHSATKATFNR